LYLIFTLVHKRPLLTFFAIGWCTALLYAIVGTIVDLGDVDNDLVEHIMVALTVVLGLGYLLMGRSFVGSWNKRLTRVLYLFGSAGIMGSLYYEVVEYGSIWEILYFLVIGAMLYVSIRLRSKAILVVSTIALIAHISYITAEYFADSVGWPVLLVVLGLIFIGLGYNPQQNS